MTSTRQIETNRLNALKSTGPKTEAGKKLSRCNAIRHGLTAETVVDSLEDAEDYKSFEAAVTADYDAQSAIERELVLRLASLLWRLRRATTMETGLFEIHAEHRRDDRQNLRVLTQPQNVISPAAGGELNGGVKSAAASAIDFARFFCDWQTCRISRSIGSAATKPRFGDKPAAPFTRLRCWIAVSPKSDRTMFGSFGRSEIPRKQEDS